VIALERGDVVDDLVHLFITDQRRRTRIAKARVAGGADDRRGGLIRVVRLAAGDRLPQRVGQGGRQQGHIELGISVAEIADRAGREGTGPGADQAAPLDVVVSGEARFIASDVVIEGIRDRHAAPVGGVTEEQGVLRRELMIDAAIAAMNAALLDRVRDVVVGEAG
jgi:hypothetical protein